MAFTYQFGANPSIDVVRFLVADTVDAGHVFEDSEIEMVANLVCPTFAIVPTGGGQTMRTANASYRFVAAALLESLASNQARLATALKVLDITVDAGKAAQELRKQAEAMRNAERMDGSFALVEQVPDQFAARERLWKQWVRLQT